MASENGAALAKNLNSDVELVHEFRAALKMEDKLSLMFQCQLSTEPETNQKFAAVDERMNGVKDRLQAIEKPAVSKKLYHVRRRVSAFIEGDEMKEAIKPIVDKRKQHITPEFYPPMGTTCKIMFGCSNAMSKAIDDYKGSSPTKSETWGQRIGCQDGSKQRGAK